MDSKLVTADLRELQNELHDISSKWCNLGIQLRVDVGELDSIKKEGLVPADCLREMLKIWLKQVDPHPTRNALINALKSRVINEQQLASHLEKEHMTDVVIPSASAIQSASGPTVSNATPVPPVPQTSTSQTSGLQLQSQATRQPASEQTGPKPGGAKQISVGVADQVSKATEIPTIKTTAVKQAVTDEQQLDDHPQKKYTIDGVTPSATAIQSVPGSHVLIATTPIPAVPAMPQASQQTGAEQVSRGGTKQVSVGGTKLGGADQVNKATEIPTISPTARKRGSSRSEMSGSKMPKTAADAVGSYTCEFVSQPPDDLLCQKCNYVAKEPQQFNCCGKLCCKSCLAGVTSYKSHYFGSTVKCKQEPLEYFFDQRSNDQIQKLKVKCTNSNQSCGWTGDLKDLDDHRSQCPKEEIHCTLSEVGCETRLLRENLDDHLVQNQQQHFHCAVTSISRLRQELATTRGELRELQETFSRSIQTLPRIFKMSNYAQIKKNGETWYSNPFYSRKSNDCKVRLCVRPLQASEHVGVALEVLTSLQLSIPAISLTVEVLNQERDDTHYSFTPSVSFGSNMTHEKKIPVSTYLCDDCLFIRVSEKECTEKPWLVDPPMPRRPDLLSEFECDKALHTSD